MWRLLRALGLLRAGLVFGGVAACSSTSSTTPRIVGPTPQPDAAGNTVEGGQNPPPPPHVVSPCPTGADAGGTWENITPPQVTLDRNFPTPAGHNYGVVAFVMNPHDYANLYLGTSAQGIYKTTDCGATWTHINTGKGGVDLDRGRQGSMVIDPIDPNIIYADDRYGPGGVFKTTDGGVSWAQILPPAMLNVINYKGLVEWIAIDPTDHLHVTVIPHFHCEGGYAPNCMLESNDGGSTWTVIEGTPEASELGGQIMLDRNTWLWANPFGGLFRTTDHGKSWTHLYTRQTWPYLYRSPDGTFFMPGGNEGMLMSPDGTSWSAIPKTGIAEAIAVTANAMFTSGGTNANVYSSAKLTAPLNWTTLTPPVSDVRNGGWMMAGDPDHGIVYSSHFEGGFWRLTGQ